MNNSLFTTQNQIEDETNDRPTQSPWSVLVVDDEIDVHTITKITVRNFTVDDKPIEIISAFSKAEGIKLFQQHPDIALAIIDVVMESEHAGLELIDYVRNELGNKNVRLVLRTGQAGQAPESQVISQYDINDYKNKTELTTQKLKTLFYSSIRSYRDIITIERSRHGIQNVLTSTSNVLKSSTLTNFANAVLEQVVVLQGHKSHAVYASTFPNNDDNERQHYFVAATAEYQKDQELVSFDSLPQKIKTMFSRALENENSMRFDEGYVAYLKTSSGHKNVLAVVTEKSLSNHDLELLELYCSNVSLTYEMLLKNEDMVEVQRQLVFLLGEAVESRSKETGAHVKRVSIMSQALALKIGLSSDEAEVIRYASPLHDIGKIAIPDHILNKPGKLEGEEWEIMKTHAEIGGVILSKSSQRIFKVAAEIARCHHERWDGKGYPQGLANINIPIAARIVTLADVFDALGSKRCYKSAWGDEEIRAFIQEQSSQIFDPELVDILIEQFDYFTNIRIENPDLD
jgi:response regulator RpfG family c-di-GMP phosphodiesterase